MSQRTGNPGLRYAVDEDPPQTVLVGLSIQNALFVISGAIFLPILLRQLGLVTGGEAAFLIAATLLTGGLSTAIQAIRIGYVGSGYMLFMGTSGAFFAATIDAVELAGIGFVAALSLIAAPTEWIVAGLLRPLRNVFTPVVGGVVVMCVATTIVPLTIDGWVGKGTPLEGSAEYLVIGAVTALVMVGLIVMAPARYRLWSPIAALAAGSVAALIFGEWHFTNTSDAAIVGFPLGEWETPTFPLNGEAAAVLVAFFVATLAGTFETVGDAVAVQRVSNREPQRINYEVVRGALNADGVGNALAGLMCTTPNTTYSTPTGMIPVVGVASRKIGVYGGGLMMALAFFPVVSGFVLDIPGPAINAMTFVSLVLLFIMGMQLVIEEGVTGRSALLVGISFWGGFAFERDLFFPEMIPDWLSPITSSAISTGGALAVLISAIYLLLPRKRFRWRGRAEMAELEGLLEFAQSTSRQLRVGGLQSYRLQLCLEEVFSYLVEAGSDTERELQITITAAEEGLEVDVTDRTSHGDGSLPDIAEPSLLPELSEASPEELQQLGLVLLGGVASRVTHQTIDDWHYVQFRLDRPLEAADAVTTLDI